MMARAIVRAGLCEQHIALEHFIVENVVGMKMGLRAGSRTFEARNRVRA